MATKVAQQTIRFLSANRALRMTRQTQGEILLPNGNSTRNPAQPEVTYEFDRGELELRVGQDMMADLVDPETGELVEQDAIGWLRSTPEYGTRIIEVEPVAPPASDVLSLVAVAAAAGDIDGLKALGDQEHATWDRGEVLAVIEEALDRLESVEPAKAK